MLKLVIPGSTICLYDSETEEFIDSSFDGVTLFLEHSLYSLAKWESKWHKPFLKKDGLSEEELKDYVQFMTVWPKRVDPVAYQRLTADDYKKILDYIADPMTATTFQKNEKTVAAHRSKVVTAELLYYSMIAYNIPFECEKWHLNRLQTLIHVCEIKNQDPKHSKMSRSAMARQYGALNAARRAKQHSSG